MPDTNEVITGLELCTEITQDGCLMLCPYKDERDETYSGFCEQVLKRDALSLLKEQQEEIQNLRKENHSILTQFHEWVKKQKAVEPVRGEDDDFYCGRCGKKIARAIKICDGYGFVTTHPDHLKPECKCNFCKYCGQAVKWDDDSN